MTRRTSPSVRAVGVVLAVPLALASGTTACGGGSAGSSSRPSGAPLASGTLLPTMQGSVQVFDLHGTPQNLFSAGTLEAKPGTVRIVLHVDPGSAPHNVTFNELGKAATPTVDAGGTGSVTVAVPDTGVYTFSCTIHPGMRAALHVG